MPAAEGLATPGRSCRDGTGSSNMETETTWRSTPDYGRIFGVLHKVITVGLPMVVYGTR